MSQLKQFPAGQQAYEDYWARQMDGSGVPRSFWLGIREKGTLVATDGSQASGGADPDGGCTASGVSQSQVACIEKRGYDAYTLTTLRRYIDALGDGFSLEVIVQYDRLVRRA